MSINLDNHIILVTGATGQQGGATARQLLQAGAKVRALTRKPEGKNAIVLKNAGAEIVKGNLNDPESLDLAMKGVNAVFCVTNFWEIGTGKKELIQSQNLVDAARKNNVQHFVLASIARCDDNPGLAHFVTKHQAELYIQESKIPYTFLRAVYFMDNLKPGSGGDKLHWAFLKKYLGKNGKLQMISCEDIGWFSASALLNPDDWVGKTMDLAGEELSYAKALEAFNSVFNKKPKSSFFMLTIVCWLMPEIRKMFEWYKSPRFQADIKKLKLIHPQLMSLKDYFASIKPIS